MKTIKALIIFGLIFNNFIELVISQNDKEAHQEVKLQNFIALFFPRINESDIYYFLYTRNNSKEPFEMKQDFDVMNKNLTVKVIIHGFTENGIVYWYKQMTEAYLKKEDCQIIAIDWSNKAKPPYIQAVAAAKPVGTMIGDFIIALLKSQQIILQNLHIIGHSLGSHVAGFVGKHIYKVTGNKVPTITALDPAGPWFEMPFVSGNDRLSKTDSLFVNVIHTDGGRLGFKTSIGHADFFPNGGSADQPGCTSQNFDNMSDFICSHQRSHQYFIESVNSNGFIAKPCDSWFFYEMGYCDKNHNVPFGENAVPNYTGDFYLRTDSHSPYALL